MSPVVGTGVTDALAWVVIGLFLGAWAAESRDRELARRLAALAWVAFAGFWVLVVPYFALVMRSPIETVLGSLAVLGSLYAGVLVYRGREELFTLSRAVAVMGLIYLPFASVPVLRQAAVELVAAQVHATIGWLGYEAALRTGPNGFQSALVFAILLSMIFANVLFLIIGYVCIPLFAKVVTIRKSLLLPLTLVFAFAGSWVFRAQPFDLPPGRRIGRMYQVAVLPRALAIFVAIFAAFFPLFRGRRHGAAVAVE